MRQFTDAEFQDLQREADELVSKPGNVRGIAGEFETDYIRKRCGDEGVKAVEEVMGKLGCPFSYESTSQYEWYPEGKLVLGMVVAYRMFEWNEEDLFEWGQHNLKISFLVKVLMKFTSFERTLENAPFVWNKHYDFGDFRIYKFDEEAKEVRAKMTGCNFHSIMPPYYAGYFTALLRFATGYDSMLVSVESCPSTDDPACHEFIAHW